MDLLVKINEWLWNPLIVLSLGLGLFLTVRTRLLQVRRLPDMVRQLRGGSSSEEGISSFQALALTLSSRIGVGNIAGVATAIYAGGPGALFWMGVMAFLGGATAFVESTLAQIYKERVDGQFRGGIPYYLEKGLGLRWLGVIAAVTAVSLYAVLAPGIQSNNIASSFEGAFGVPTWVTGIVIVAALGFIVLGERKRIVGFADKVVPFMAIAYIVAAVVVLAVNITKLPEALSLVVSSALGFDSVFGGMVGAAIAWGVRRAMFSNVAGVGEGTYGSAAADVSHPAKQGLVQCFSIYVDTLMVCMATGFMIIVTGSYNVATADGKTVVNHLDGVEAGPAYTQTALDTVGAGVGGPVVAIALALFAFTTLVAFYYICDTSLTYLLRGTNRAATMVLKLVLLGMTFFGSVQAADLIWAIGDVGYASLAWVNLVCLLFMLKPALAALRDYDEQRRAGVDPTFDPVRLGIRHADYWVARQAEATKADAPSGARRH